jgi:hypothetical protein
MKLLFSSSYSTEQFPSGIKFLPIPVAGSGVDFPPLYFSVFVREDDNKTWLSKREARKYLDCSDTTLNRLANLFPFIKSKISKSGGIFYNRIVIDEIIAGKYN